MNVYVASILVYVMTLGNLDTSNDALVLSGLILQGLKNRTL